MYTRDAIVLIRPVHKIRVFAWMIRRIMQSESNQLIRVNNRCEKIYGRSQHTYPWIPLDACFGDGNFISIVLITKKLAREGRRFIGLNAIPRKIESHAFVCMQKTERVDVRRV